MAQIYAERRYFWTRCTAFWHTQLCHRQPVELNEAGLTGLQSESTGFRTGCNSVRAFVTIRPLPSETSSPRGFAGRMEVTSRVRRRRVGTSGCRANMRIRIVKSEVEPTEAAAEGTAFSASTPEFDVGARTDIGRRRTNNEDNFSIVPELGLFVLSDGMGGEAAGEMASKIAVEEISRYMREVARNGNLPPLEEPNPQFSENTNHLGAALRCSNRVIWEAAQQQASQRGMGATVDAALLQTPVLSIGHVGDSRIYLWRGGQLQQLTDDHSLVMEQVRRGLMSKEEAEQSDVQNILIRAMGTEQNVTVDLDEVFVMPGDQLLLCSDGLTRMVPELGIAQVLGEAKTPKQACNRLVEIANDNGGEDNITAVVVRLRDATRKGLWGWLKSLFT